MPYAADCFRVPDDPREILMLLDMLRVRVLAFVETLEITDDEIGTLRADCAALTETVRATEAAEALARDWREFQARLLQGTDAAVVPPPITAIPPVMGNAGVVVREARAARNPAMRAGIENRLQRFIDRLLAHPDTTDQTRLDLGLLPDATIGFSRGVEPGQLQSG